MTLLGGILARVFDHEEFHTVGKGMWFALQTVTTVGYGDATPRHTEGRIIGAVVMLSGIAFLAVITASVTAALIEGSRRRFARADAEAARQLEEINARLARIEEAIGQQPPKPGGGGATIAR